MGRRGKRSCQDQCWLTASEGKVGRWVACALEASSLSPQTLLQQHTLQGRTCHDKWWERRFFSTGGRLRKHGLFWGEMSYSYQLGLASTVKVFKERIIWGGGQSLHLSASRADYFLIGWWWCNREVLWESCAHPSPGWGEAWWLVPAEELRGIVNCIS